MKAVFIAVCGGLFVAAGLLCFRAVGSHLFSYAFTGVGCVTLVCAIASFARRVVVTPVGIKMTHGGFSVNWENVESWSVEDFRKTHDGGPCVSFRIRGWRWAAKIEDSEVANPGFEKLVAEIRRYAQTKEKA